MEYKKIWGEILFIYLFFLPLMNLITWCGDDGPPSPIRFIRGGNRFSIRGGGLLALALGTSGKGLAFWSGPQWLFFFLPFAKLFHFGGVREGSRCLLRFLLNKMGFNVHWFF